MEQQPIKIALAGADCDSKTNFCAQLQTTYQLDHRVITVGDTIRTFLASRAIPDRSSYVTQTKIQDLILAGEQKAESAGARVIITNPSVIDGVVYVRAVENVRGAQRLWERVADRISSYDHIFLLNPISTGLEHNNIHRENERAQILFHEQFVKIFQAAQIPYMLLSGDLEGRIQKVEQVVQRALTESFEPINPLSLGEEELHNFLRIQGEITHPNDERYSFIKYNGSRRLRAFVREGRLGIGSAIRVSDYGRSTDAYFSITEQGLASMTDNSDQIFLPEDILNEQEAAPWGWTIED